MASSNQLLDLPNELLGSIAQQLGCVRDIVTAASLNHRFYALCAHSNIRYRPIVGSRDEFFIDTIRLDSVFVLRILRALPIPLNPIRYVTHTVAPGNEQGLLPKERLTDNITAAISTALAMRILPVMPMQQTHELFL